MTSGTSNNGGRSAQTFWGPSGVHTDGTRLFVADYTNCRVLIWNTIPTSTQTAADVVLGQPNMTAGNLGTTAQRLDNPYAVHTVGTRLFVVDYSNHRVLIWNTIPTVNETPADAVLGQPNMTSGTANNGGRSAQSLAHPTSVYSDGVRVFVADHDNDRIVTFDIP